MGFIDGNKYFGAKPAERKAFGCKLSGYDRTNRHPGEPMVNTRCLS